MENKIKIDMKAKGNSSFKIGESTIKIKSWLKTEEMAFIIDECLACFKDLISGDNEDSICLISTLLKMDMLIVALATNLDIEDLEANVVGETGLFNAIREKVLNYEIIKSAVLAGTNMVGNGLIIENMKNIASLDDLSDAENQIKGYMEGENSGEMNKLIEVMLANNPILANKLNESVSQGDEKNEGNK